MRKKDLVKFVSDDIGVVQREISIIVDSVLRGIFNGIVENDMVTFQNFGAFHKVVRQARTATNPRTGEKISVPERTTVTFKLSKKLKEEINS
jgi:nucleoid DNA-binding protein